LGIPVRIPVSVGLSAEGHCGIVLRIRGNCPENKNVPGEFSNPGFKLSRALPIFSFDSIDYIDNEG
jgi:hypothetical protein